jgi:cell division protein FtsQ
LGSTTETDDAAVVAEGVSDASAGRGRRRARRRRLRRSIIAAGVVCALPGVWALAVRSPLVRARVIDVAGAAHVTRSQALRLAGISRSTNVASLDTAAAASRLESDPWIARAIVRKDLPWTIRIELVERTPVLAVGAGPWAGIVAGDGTVLEGVSRGAGAFPVLRTAPRDATPATAELTIERAASALAPISPRARDAIRAVSIARDGSLKFGLRGGGTILYGDDANADAKARTLVALLRWSESEDEEVVSADLRVAGAPTARLRPAGAD